MNTKRIDYSSDVWYEKHLFSFGQTQCTLTLSDGKLSLEKQGKTIFVSPVSDVRIKLRPGYYDQINFYVNSKKYRLFFKPQTGRLGTFNDVSGSKAKEWQDVLVGAGVVLD